MTSRGCEQQVCVCVCVNACVCVFFTEAVLGWKSNRYLTACRTLKSNLSSSSIMNRKPIAVIVRPVHPGFTLDKVLGNIDVTSPTCYNYAMECTSILRRVTHSTTSTAMVVQRFVQDGPPKAPVER